jgi:hypothetical protein
VSLSEQLQVFIVLMSMVVGRTYIC